MTDKLDNQIEGQDVGTRGGGMQTKGASHSEQLPAAGAERRTGGNTQTKSGSKLGSPASDTHAEPTAPGSVEDSANKKS